MKEVSSEKALISKGVNKIYFLHAGVTDHQIEVTRQPESCQSSCNTPVAYTCSVQSGFIHHIDQRADTKSFLTAAMNGHIRS